ncbi:hypothetical protein, partial [Bariatricus sp. HCP28S3_C2]|uniref:hypothetical protein n=1 Tax=unclassified Bariatricus TaxID=2677046 RepID=UPI003F8B751F
SRPFSGGESTIIYDRQLSNLMTIRVSSLVTAHEIINTRWMVRNIIFWMIILVVKVTSEVDR